MTRVILVRHAEPQVDTDIPASAWILTVRGEDATRRLVSRIAALRPATVVSSPECKALQTAGLLVEALDLSMTSDERFAEQGAESGAFEVDYAKWRASVQEHFARPDDVVLRGESSRAAGGRFGSGIALLKEKHPATTPVIVSHGRIMASWLSQLAGSPAMEVWTALRMPDLIDVDLTAGTYRSIHIDLV